MVGVVWHDAKGKTHTTTADRVLVSAGVYNTPAILQRSGIGPAALLRGHGIPVLANLPTGSGLTDNPGAPFFFHAPAIGGAIGRIFAVNWRGPAMHGEEPEWQTQYFPGDPVDGVCGMWTYLTLQQSRGTVEIQGSDPALPPLIDHDYLGHSEDIARFGRAWKAAQELLATSPFQQAGTRWLEPAIDIEAHCNATLGSAHLDDTVIDRNMQRHCHQAFIRFLNSVEREVPKGKAIHVIGAKISVELCPLCP